MITLDRRNFLAGTAGLAFLAAYPSVAFSQADGAALKIAIAAETGNLDLLQNVSTLSTYTVVFDGLIHYGQNGELVPGLATKWVVSEDQLSIAFDLREGVTFSDGTPFDSTAAEWNLKRWMGKSDFSWIGVSDAYDSIVTDGPAKLTVKLKRPVPAALLEFTIVRPVRFLSPKAVDADGKQTAPIGTGPWIVETYDSSTTVLKRNDSYWGEKPIFSRMELKVVPDELARANGLRSGNLDIIGGDWVATLSPRRARALESDGMKVVAEPGTATMLLGFSPKSLMVADKAVRDAIYMAVDRAAIAKVLFEGYADPSADLFPANVPSSGKRHDVPQRDIAKAKALLTAGGWTESGNMWMKGSAPLMIDFLVSDESLPGSRRVAEMIQAQLSEVGFQVKVSSVDNATMHDRRPAFEYDLAFFTTYGAPYDPHGTLGNSFVSTADSGPDGKIYVSPELDGVVKAALEASGAEREVKMQGVYDWLFDNTAICPLVVAQRLWAHGTQIENFSLPATDYDLPFKGISPKA
ncbi:MAG: ABC transporter substrate-binding protein [Allorhizobium sp.]